MRSDEDRSGRHADLDRDNPDIGHAGAITEETRCHTLEFAAVGPAFGNRLRHGWVWRDHGIQPWRAEAFKFSTDP